MSISLPSEILFDLLVKSSLPTLAKLCSSAGEINDICNDEYFWKTKTLQDYPNASLPSQLSWKQYYVALAQKRIRILPVYLNGEFYKHESVDRNETMGELVDEIMKNVPNPEDYKIVFTEFGVPLLTVPYLYVSNSPLADHISKGSWESSTNFLSIKLVQLNQFEKMRNKGTPSNIVPISELVGQQYMGPINQISNLRSLPNF